MRRVSGVANGRLSRLLFCGRRGWCEDCELRWPEQIKLDRRMYMSLIEPPSREYRSCRCRSVIVSKVLPPRNYFCTAADKGASHSFFFSGIQALNVVSDPQRELFHVLFHAAFIELIDETVGDSALRFYCSCLTARAKMCAVTAAAGGRGATGRFFSLFYDWSVTCTGKSCKVEFLDLAECDLNAREE